MKRWIIISLFLTVLAGIPAMGQGKQVLTDGISGRDRLERYLFIQAISPQGDSCMVMTDSLGRFEIDAELMTLLPGNVYLKPMTSRPKAKLTLDSPFDSINVYRQGRDRYLSQNLVFEPDQDEPLFYYDPETTLLREATVKAKRYSVARDKVTGYLDSLAIMSTGAWVCDCEWAEEGVKGFLNDYNGYTHHPEGSFLATEYFGQGRKRIQPIRGHKYALIKLEHYPESRYGDVYVVSDFIPDFTYTGPDLSEEDLLEINGMWKAQGYYPRREFYEPDTLDLTSPTPDYRNLLQWRPAVLTDENGIAEITFAASDVYTEFIGLVEAVDGMGLMGAQTFIFRIFKQ